MALRSIVRMGSDTLQEIARGNSSSSPREKVRELKHSKRQEFSDWFFDYVIKESDIDEEVPSLLRCEIFGNLNEIKVAYNQALAKKYDPSSPNSFCSLSLVKKVCIIHSFGSINLPLKFIIYLQTDIYPYYFILLF